MCQKHLETIQSPLLIYRLHNCIHVLNTYQPDLYAQSDNDHKCISFNHSFFVFLGSGRLHTPNMSNFGSNSCSNVILGLSCEYPLTFLFPSPAHRITNFFPQFLHFIHSPSFPPPYQFPFSICSKSIQFRILFPSLIYKSYQYISIRAHICALSTDLC